MRRPSPLPPPTRPPAPVDEPPIAPAHDATPPVVPLESPAPVEWPGSRGADPIDDLDATDPDVTDADVTDAGAPVRLRDVWGASRARRRAMRAEVRRFTVRQRHRRALWIGVAASLLVLVLVTLGAAYSPLFGVEEIRVVGAKTLDASAVETALADQIGTPLPLVDESAVKAALVGFPLVESYTLEARPPHELVVRIVERTPIGLIKSAAGYTLVDAAGVALSTTEEPAAGRPVLKIVGGTGSDAFAAVGRVMRSLPESIRSQVTAVEASTPNDVTLTLGGTNTDVVWGSSEQSGQKAIALESIMKTSPPEDVSTYDVSSPTAVVVR